MSPNNSLALQARLPHLNLKECRNPRLVIEYYFDDADMAEERRLLEHWLRCAFSCQRLPEEKQIFIPALQLNLIRLLEAASQLAENGLPAGIKMPHEADLLNPCWFFYRRNDMQIASDYFPKYLCTAQNINPYLVFSGSRGRLSLDEWEALLQDMYAAATSSRKMIYDISKNKKAYAHGHALLKLLEAAHLVYVREVIPAVALAHELAA